jgi:hypothetical protein
MRIHTSDKFIAWATLLSGLTVSAVAIYYSVAGLVAIFSAAVIPIIVMGVALEISKLAGTVWLKQNWTRAPYFIRAYLLAAIAILMLITSMGIFGFLSKAHSDQSLVSGDVQSRIAVYDDKIKTAKDNIDANRKALKQMDDAVDQVMGRSSDEKGADKAVQIRRSQQKERARLQSEIVAEQKIVAAISQERAPIAAEVRKVEAEVGPIKYIAAFIYGDNPDANILEKAVTWVIIIIVAVFDPLAVILLLASQYSFQWFRRAREEQTTEGDSPTSSESVDLPTVTTQPIEDEQLKSINDFVPQPTEYIPEEEIKELKYELDDSPLTNEQLHQIAEAVKTVKPDLAEKIEQLANTHTETIVEPIETQPTALGGDITAPEELYDEDDDLDDEDDSSEIREAKKNWKHDHPTDSLKRHKRLFEKGQIDRLPWENYLAAEPDFTDNEAAEEAAKWAMEQVEESKKKDNDMDRTQPGQTDSKDTARIEGYIQNAEQTELSIWQKVKQSKGQE